MKHFILLMTAALMSVMTVEACAKKTHPQVVSSSPLTLIVTDTTQSLLPEAQVKIGKTLLRTSYDGRVVLTPQMRSENATITVSCKGFQTRKYRLLDIDAQLIALTPVKAPKTSSKAPAHVSLRRDGVMLKMASVSADFKMMEEAEVVMPAKTGGMVNNAVSAGLLTAGEVNDFAKWTLWPKIIDGSHKAFVQEWQLAPRERYTVQVTDKHGYPIVNYLVNLTDINGNTVFQALTDNTGKAELWNGLMTGNGEPVKVKEPQKTVVLDEPCDLSDAVDVLFVFDATGSMGDELRYLQAEMRDVIARATEATGGLAIRTGAVVYRDHGDDYITRISRLTKDIRTTQTFIDKQEANGGGDYPEAVPEALMAALNSAGWDANARARILFLILDAPCHQDSATLALLHEQILNAAALGVRIVPVVCSGLGESGEYLLRAMALATNGTSFFLTDDSGIGHPHLKPSTDSLQIEHLNDMLVRTIVEFSYMPDCTGHWHEEQIAHVSEQFLPNPFDTQDIETDPTIPHGETTLYLVDISGKLIYTYRGSLDEAGERQLSALHLSLATGIYFVKAYYDGQWFTKKILVH